MRILIVGAGTIGANLATVLAREGQDVVVVDTNQERLARLEASADCQIYHGDATSALALEDLGIRRTDLVVAVTERDAVNMTVCRLAEHYHTPRKLARIRNAEYAAPDCPIPPEHLGMDHIISPEALAVDHIERLVLCPGSREAIDFEHGRVALRALVVSEESTLAGEQLLHVARNLPGDFLIAAIRRGRRVIVPDGNQVLRVGDTVYLVSEPDQVPALAAAFQPDVSAARRVLIFGAGITGSLLAKRLAGQLRVSLIEPDLARAEQAAEELDELGVEVLHGSALDVELLSRCHVETADFFIAATPDDEKNIMSSLLFRKFGNGTPVVLTTQQDYVDILEGVDLDIVINPRTLAVSSLLGHIRGGGVVTVARLLGEQAEVIEFAVGTEAKVTKQPLKDLKLPRGMLIVAVLRGDALHIPGGDFRVQANDRVLVFLQPELAERAGPLFR